MLARNAAVFSEASVPAPGPRGKDRYSMRAPKWHTVSADKFGVPRRYPNTVEQRRSRKTSSRKPVGIVVRRGALQRFDSLTRKTAELPVVVSWDRRSEDRRACSEPMTRTNQRKTERRQKPPFTWEVADFVVLDSPPHHPATSARQRTTAAKQRKRRN